MAKCLLCGDEGPLISQAIGACGACLREGSPQARSIARGVHARWRRSAGLPPSAMRDVDCVPCTVCAQQCQPAEGERGLCGTRARVGPAVVPLTGTPKKATVTFRHDPLPTNCCARFVCAGCTTGGYPEYSHAPGAEHGFKNLAVGYYGCTFSCLYCQSWEVLHPNGPQHSADEVAAQVDEETSCICFFGGDPTAQLGHALETGRVARRRAKARGRPLRLCFETNGAMHPKLLEQVADLALESGGCVKFDLKAWHPEVHQALCGAAPGQVYDNFALLAERAKERPELPLAIAATALVPGYVDEEEVAPIGYFSCHQLADVPNTSKQHARRCLTVARSAGLKNVQVDNQELLRDARGERRSRQRPA
jgi:pyruvate formate lyase activating enzyme